MLSKSSQTQTECIVWFHLQKAQKQAKLSSGWEAIAVILGGKATRRSSWWGRDGGGLVMFYFFSGGSYLGCSFCERSLSCALTCLLSLWRLYFIRSSYWKEQGWGEFFPGSGSSSNDWFSRVAEAGVPARHQCPVPRWQCVSRIVLRHDLSHGSGFPACLVLTSPLRVVLLPFGGSYELLTSLPVTLFFFFFCLIYPSWFSAVLD